MMISCLSAETIMTLANILFLYAVGNVAAADDFTDKQLEFFESKVRPLLSQRCYKCHGVKKEESGLRLDSRGRVLQGGSRGYAVTPGDLADDSLLLKAVSRSGKLKMPPEASEALSQSEIAVLRTWIRMGVPWPKGEAVARSLGDQDYLFKKAESHWSFKTINRPQPPTNAPSTNAIDAFVVKSLNEARLKPSPPADKRSLLRRAYFDLTGLAPSASEYAEFERDSSDQAFPVVVDRLLSSPHYGERWGRYWLDVARYADTRDWHSAIDMRYPYAYTFRDYVIQAFNRDLPFDQFIREQLAADLYPHEPDSPSLAALGLHTVGPRFRNRNDEIISDRIDVVTRGVLGLTVTCARCHDHKYDPIPTDDYYSLYGIFASSQEPKDYPRIRGYTISKPKLDAYMKKRGVKEKELDKFMDRVRKEGNDDLRKRLTEYLFGAYDFNPAQSRIRAFSTQRKLKQSILNAMIQRLRDIERLKEWKDHPILGVWAAAGRVDQKDFKKRLDEYLAKPPHALNPRFVERLENRPADARQLLERIAQFITESQKAWNAARKKAPKLTTLEDPALDQARKLLEAPFNVTTQQAMVSLGGADRRKKQKLDRELQQIDATHPGAPARAMTIFQRPNPTNPQVFIRGNAGRRGDRVPRRFLTVLAGKDAPGFETGGRKELAEAITSKENPLTARVMVNRVWLHLMGQGLVDTPGDFGLRTPRPSHPELLDYLAWKFMDEGWSVKRLIRSIVLSDVYQQSSRHRADAAAVDPENRLYWRANRRRLDFEAMRDNILAASGHLDRTMRGKAQKLFKKPFTGRRTVYGYIDRLNFSETFAAFDVPNPDQTSPARHETLVPQQALYQLNSPFIISEARRLVADKSFTELADRIAKIHAIYDRIFGRHATTHEITIADSFLNNVSSPDKSTSIWEYGYGPADPATPTANQFTPMPYFNGEDYRGSATFPDPHFSYLLINATGGHTGKSSDFSTIVRFRSPINGDVRISGRLTHRNHNCGDGIRGLVLSRKSGIIGEWIAFKNGVDTTVDIHTLKKGELLDFIVDCQTNASCDSYDWDFTVQSVGKDSSVAWNSKDSFSGPRESALSSWAQLAQALFLTNEFMFVD